MSIRRRPNSPTTFYFFKKNSPTTQWLAGMPIPPGEDLLGIMENASTFS